LVLKKKAIQSVKGTAVSTSIPAATSWLISDYLPNNGYAQTSALWMTGLFLSANWTHCRAEVSGLWILMLAGKAPP
jgi:hypothetical protein